MFTITTIKGIIILIYLFHKEIDSHSLAFKLIRYQPSKFCYLSMSLCEFIVAASFIHTLFSATEIIGLMLLYMKMILFSFNEMYRF